MKKHIKLQKMEKLFLNNKFRVSDVGFLFSFYGYIISHRPLQNIYKSKPFFQKIRKLLIQQSERPYFTYERSLYRLLFYPNSVVMIPPTIIVVVPTIRVPMQNAIIL